MRTERVQAMRTAVDAALSIADEVAKGILNPHDLDAVAEAECRALFGTVVGPDDPLWLVHCDVARQVLAHNGMPANELAEWLAVIRASEAGPRVPSWIETALAAGCDGKCATDECVCPVSDL